MWPAPLPPRRADRQFIIILPPTHVVRYVEPARAKILMALFFATGVIGMYVGLAVAPTSMTMIITLMGVINFGLGAFFAYLLLTQEERPSEKEKRMRRRKKGRHPKNGGSSDSGSST